MSELILFRDEKEEPMSRPAGAFLYQHIHVHDGHPLHLEQHIQLLNTASRQLFKRDFRPNPSQLAGRIAELLHKNRYPQRGSSFVRIELPATGAIRLLPAGISLYDGYALGAIRHKASVRQYDYPMPEYPTSAGEATTNLILQCAEQEGITAVIRSDRNELVRSVNNAPLFAVKGETVYTPPSPPSVERELALRLIQAVGLPLHEQEIGCEQLPLFDELFYFNHRGIYSIARCGSALYADIITSRLARRLDSLLSPEKE